MIKLTSITEYIAQFPPEIQDRLATIRKLIHEQVPEAVEVISYEMPALKYRKKILVYFAAFKIAHYIVLFLGLHLTVQKSEPVTPECGIL